MKSCLVTVSDNDGDGFCKRRLKLEKGFYDFGPISGPLRLGDNSLLFFSPVWLFLLLGFMVMEKKLPQPICGQEAVNLLNCVSESKFDQEKCVLLLQSLRECVLSKKVTKFSIPSEDHNQDGAASLSKRP
ncbi:uncharacterized protein LOC110227738 [Arabidopsis lyrata subsp. lyrata]|uniref:uncharacterized protein LOC110227738 n=1 Tax=Arabidopsis lyrata subsp. lyrata TaxID=81972 RepID=UPI000A29DAEE|nr:uncharacterized protein LOC110227738 [Arabidopsis lyrata subsp. lyrata]|eukprot:XP_020878811.1 uncharacterized protein LOC110227738 [Arabidopsis lyrata subsp. lyrata]